MESRAMVVLCATDFSACAAGALRQAVSLAEALGPNIAPERERDESGARRANSGPTIC